MRHAEAAGADGGAGGAALLQPPQPGRACSRITAISTDNSDLPIILYNVPGRTVTDISVETMARAGEDRRRSSASRMRAARSSARPPSGSPAARTSASFRAMTTWRSASWRWAASGCISVTANVAPRLCAEFQAACLGGDWASALALAGPAVPAARAPCSPMPRPGRSNMPCRASAPASPPTSACR